MDKYSGKKGSDGLFVSRKGTNLVLKDTANNRDQNARFCNRIGCNGRMNTAKGTQINFHERAKSSRTSFRSSSNGKELVGSSSRTSTVPANPKKSFPGPGKKLSSQPDRDPSGTSSLTRVLEVVVPISGKIRKGIENRSTEVGSSSRSFYQKLGTGKLDSPSGSRPKGSVKRRICEEESSNSSSGEKIGGLRFEGRNPRVSISDSRRTRNGISSPNQDNAPVAVRTRRSFSYTSLRVSNQVGRNITSANEPHAVNQQACQPVMPMDSTSSSSFMDSTSSGSLHQFSMESPSSLSRSYGIWPSSPAELGSFRSSISHEGFRRYNMDGIAEVLLALERIEQDEELTYEQLLVVETGLFLNGLNFYDQHRDMRLDIDDMSYEELLALEERMGSVSTALTEEAFSECVKTSIFCDSSSLKHCQDDVKCCVCQEEYTIGDEIGRLQCEHKYHVACIHQWLRMKNWCPICKAPAAPSSSSSLAPLMNI